MLAPMNGAKNHFIDQTRDYSGNSKSGIFRTDTAVTLKSDSLTGASVNCEFGQVDVPWIASR
jgi:hypothetical protein